MRQIPGARPHTVLVLLCVTLILVMGLTACGSSATAPANSPEEQAAEVQDDATAADDEEAHADEEAHTDEKHDHTDEEAHADEEHDHAEEATSIDALIAALEPIAEGETLNVVATTTIVGDVVSQVGGDAINLTTLLPVGADPHTFEPNPQEVGTVADANVVFVNGFNLEETLLSVIENAGIAPERIIPVSVGIDTIEFGDEHEHEKDEHEHEGEEHDHEHTGIDPHTWMSPVNVTVWTDNVATVLTTLDPANADTYTANATSYTSELEELDAWIAEQIAQIPAEHRDLVTDHSAFGYYAHDYGLEQIGAVVPAYSTLAEPSAQDLAELQAAIAEFDVPAIFVGTTVNPALAEQVATDTGVQLLPVYTGSLSDADGPVPSYIVLMRYNTEQFVAGLSE